MLLGETESFLDTTDRSSELVYAWRSEKAVLLHCCFQLKKLVAFVRDCIKSVRGGIEDLPRLVRR